VAAGAAPRERPLDGVVVAVRTPDPFVRQAATAQIETSGGRVARQAGVTLIDHAMAEDGALMVKPSQGEAIILLKPGERDLIRRAGRGQRTIGHRGDAVVMRQVGDNAVTIGGKGRDLVAPQSRIAQEAREKQQDGPVDHAPASIAGEPWPQAVSP
jgi:hypothetical protein